MNHLENIEPFCDLWHDPAFFGGVKVDFGGYEIRWSDDIDLSCDELWNNGQTIDNQKSI